MNVRQTTCRHCGLDIEGLSPYRRGAWRDRGNNTTCPSGPNAGGKHAPVLVLLQRQQPASVPPAYNDALRDAREMMEMAEGLEPTSALKQAASDRGIPYGREMAAFVNWAFKQWGI